MPGAVYGQDRKNMKAELEQIAACDEKARTHVQTAEAEARGLLENARSQADHLKSGMENKIAQVKKDEIEPVIQEAEERARGAEAEAHAYMDRLRERVKKHRDEILDSFISSALGELWSPSGR